MTRASSHTARRARAPLTKAAMPLTFCASAITWATGRLAGRFRAESDDAAARDAAVERSQADRPSQIEDDRDGVLLAEPHDRPLPKLLSIWPTATSIAFSRSCRYGLYRHGHSLRAISDPFCRGGSPPESERKRRGD